MESCTLRFLNLFEALAFSALVGWYIWRLQASYFFAWLVFPVWMIVSIVLHGDTPKTIGWRADNLGSATIRSAVFFAPCIAGLCLAVVLLGALHRPVHHLFVPKHFLGYMAAGTIFAALHWPNPVLVPLTFIGGVAMAWLFARERNIIPLAIGQGVLGTLVWWAFPVAWHHAMRVGPGFYTFHPR